MGKKKLVVKSNHLVKASYSMTAVEQRLFSLAMVLARENGLLNEPLPANQVAPPLVVETSAYSEFFKLDRFTAYEQVIEAKELLESRKITFFSDDPHFPLDLLTEHEIEQSALNIVSRTDLLKGKTGIIIEFNHYVFRLFSAELVKTHFTRHYLENTIGMTSFYAIRLYEVLTMWRTTKKVPPMAIAEFRRIMGIADELYPLTGTLKQGVINTAIKQINKFSDIKAVCKDIKKGRAIVAFEFSFEYKHATLLSNLELEKCRMTDAQRALFSSKLLEFDPARFGELCGTGKSAAACKAWIEEELKKGERLVEWWHLLEAVGFSRTSLKPVEDVLNVQKTEPDTPPIVEEPIIWDVQRIMSMARRMLEGTPGLAFLKRHEAYFEGLNSTEIHELLCMELETADGRERWKSEINAVEPNSV